MTTSGREPLIPAEYRGPVWALEPLVDLGVSLVTAMMAVHDGDPQPMYQLTEQVCFDRWVDADRSTGLRDLGGLIQFLASLAAFNLELGVRLGAHDPELDLPAAWQRALAALRQSFTEAGGTAGNNGLDADR